MKLDRRYLKGLLQACVDSPGPTFDIEELKSAGFEHDDPRFEFHLMILTDQGFIERDDQRAGIGLQKSIDGYLSWAVLPLRLTASGQRFFEALTNESVWRALEKNFPDASIGTLESASLGLLANYNSNVVNNIVHNTTNIGTAQGSVIQQTGAHSSQQYSAYDSKTQEELSRLMDQLSAHLDELKLDPGAGLKVTAQIGTIRSQLEAEPNPSIIREAGRTLRNVTEGAIGSLLASAAQPTVWLAVAETMKRLFS